MAARVLVVEDEPDIRDLIVFHLEREGFRARTAQNGADALKQIRTAPPDLVVLDLMLPELDGLEVCRRLRQDPSTAAVPVIMLTAKGDEADRIVGLELGADDYITKPFSPKELVARIKAVLRRTHGAEGPDVFVVGALRVDFGKRQLAVGGAPVPLTPKEFDLLRALVEARGRVLSREFLLDRVWGYARAGEIASRTVDVHVRRLRQKLGADGRRIVTAKTAGYRFEVAD
ncbi:MAG: DNA-binding response regulator [Candidatus Rokubacteria bacterium RIFCSPLOWO2_12_FULL_69_21]|nr:MAG: DNA-binding response regulator [Candidatus Rokubacteria bacterium RIFCSPLOWO2_12_FULL_69_21]